MFTDVQMKKFMYIIWGYVKVELRNMNLQNNEYVENSVILYNKF